MKPGMKLNKKLIAIIGGIVAAVIIVIVVLAIVLSGGKGQRSESKVGDELAKAYEKGDADAMIDLMLDDYYELYNKAMGLMGSSTYVEDQFNEDVQDMKDEVGTVKSIKIEDREEDKYEQDEIDDVNKTFDMLNVDIKVDECREIDMDIKIKGSESDADGEIVYTVIKSGSKWYLVDYDLYVD